MEHPPHDPKHPKDLLAPSQHTPSEVFWSQSLCGQGETTQNVGLNVLHWEVIVEIYIWWLNREATNKVSLHNPRKCVWLRYFLTILPFNPVPSIHDISKQPIFKAHIGNQILLTHYFQKVNTSGSSLYSVSYIKSKHQLFLKSDYSLEPLKGESNSQALRAAWTELVNDYWPGLIQTLMLRCYAVIIYLRVTAKS